MDNYKNCTYAANNPLKYHDPDGNFILDAIAIATDVYNLIKEPSWANAGWLGLSIATSPIPFFNASLLRHGGKAVSSTAKSAKPKSTIGNTDRASSGGKSAQANTSSKQSPANNSTVNKGTDKRWKVGDEVDARTAKGNYPAWSTVRKRYWKNEAQSNPESYPGNLDRMNKGLAPQQFNPELGRMESKELHHIVAQRYKLPNIHMKSNLQPVWPSEHAAIDGYRRIK